MKRRKHKYTAKQAVLSEIQSNLESMTVGDWMEVFDLTERQAKNAVDLAETMVYVNTQVLRHNRLLGGTM